VFWLTGWGVVAESSGAWRKFYGGRMILS